MRKLTNKEFIEKTIKKYGNKYDYSKVEYVNNKTKVCVICSLHGEFMIRPNDLLNGKSCPYCGGTKKMTNNEFIEKAKYVHNNFFSYEKSEYISSNEKIIVTCPIHGDFLVKANNHLKGVNCKKCQLENIKHKITTLPQINKSTKRLNQEQFLNKCYAIHGDKYSYEKAIYKTSKEKVIITCKKHGDFFIAPQHLLAGRGCSKCSNNKKLTTQEFIEKSYKIHGYKYNYDNVIYKSTHELIKITCPLHGEFSQSPANHLSGQGCPICKQSKMENNISLLLKEHNIAFEKEKTFNWLINKRNLRLDFYLPEYNIAIECQGEQHFINVPIFKSKAKDAKIKDDIKLNLCNKHGIKILYYSELDIDLPYNVITNKDKLMEIILNYKK